MEHTGYGGWFRHFVYQVGGFADVSWVCWLTVCLLGMASGVAEWAVFAEEARFAGRTAVQWGRVLDTHLEGDTEQDKAECRAATAALGYLSDSAQVAREELTRALRSPSLEVRHAAVDALGRIGAEAAESVPAMVAPMDLPREHPHYGALRTYRWLAARALGRIGPAAEAAVPALERALENEDPRYRVQAALALWRIAGRSEMIGFLAAMVQPSEAAAYEAVMALGEVGSSAAVVGDRLIAALEHPQSDVRRAAADVLVRLGPSQLEPLATAFGGADADAARAAAYALGQLLGRLREELFYRPESEPEAFQATGRRVLRIAVPPLVARLADERDAVRQAAQHALAQLGLLALPALLETAGGPDPLARRAAIETLVRVESYLPEELASPQLVAWHDAFRSRLFAAMEHRDPQVRASAYRVFACLFFEPDDRQALALLRGGLRDESLAVRRHASQVLRAWEL